VLRRLTFRRPEFLIGARAQDLTEKTGSGRRGAVRAADRVSRTVVGTAEPETDTEAAPELAATDADEAVELDAQDPNLGDAPPEEDPEEDEATELLPARAHRRITRKRIALGIAITLFVMLGGVYSQKDKITPRFADTSRNIIGDENTAKIERSYFAFQDHMDQLKYRVFGGSTNPFKAEDVTVSFVKKPAPRTVVYFANSGVPATQAILTADTMGPTPLQLPPTTQVSDSLQAGEGVWTTSGLPRTSPTDMLMAKTFIRPDKTRPYSMVGVLLVDSRRVRLNMVAGTEDPGGYRGVKGLGVIPADKQSLLVAAWNGGFKGEHGYYGMYCDGREVVPLRNGLASIAVMADGTVKIGEYGRDFVRDDNTVAVRQNAVLLVDHGEISPRVNEGNDTWGYVQVNSADFITWRSAVGMTKDGNLLIAAGNSLSAASLAKALWAAGAYTAMQLDINTPYVLISDFFPQPDGTVQAQKFMDSMTDSPSRFLKTQTRDFMYLTLDETRYR